MAVDLDVGRSGRNAPAENAVAINLASDTDLTYLSRAIWVGGAGNLKVDMPDGTTVTFTAVPAGSWLWIRCSRVYSTANGTTASNIVALW